MNIKKVKPWLLPVWLVASLVLASLAWGRSLPSGAPQDVGFDPERLARIGQTFQQEIDAGRLPGAVILVARNGQLVYSETLGVKDPATGEAMPADAIFRIYSMTKPLVSVAAMMLAEEGKLQLADPVGKFLPGFDKLSVSVPTLNPMFGRVSYQTVPADRAMTVQDLLRHTAGLAYGELTQNAPVKKAYEEAGVYLPGVRDYDARGVTAEEQIERLAKIPLVHQPGTFWEYGLASDVLGRVVEKASGQRLGEFLQQRLFEPLAMVDTGFWAPQEKQARLAQPLAIDPATGNPNNMIDVNAQPSNDSGGAGAVSTAMDYLRFSQMMLNGGELDGARILSPATVALMASDHLGERIAAPITPGELLLGTPGYTFGLGFMVREGAGIASVPGSVGEFMWAGYGGTFFWIDPAENLVAVLMTQAPGPSRAYYRRMIKQLVYQAIVN